MQLIDSHCHLDFAAFSGDLFPVLKRARDSGVSGFLVPGVAAYNWQPVLDLASQHQDIRVALGLHPYFLHSLQATDLDYLQHLLIRHPDVVAIGEIGLDKVIDFPFAEQVNIFSCQLALAKQFDLPVIIHCRQAHNEMIKLLQQAKLSRGGVIHGFSGSLQIAQSYIKLGFKLGIGGVITYPRANKTRNAVAQLPLSAILLETDCPDMPVAEKQGQRNEPCRIVDIIHSLAELQNKPMELIAEANKRNFNELFANK